MVVNRKKEKRKTAVLLLSLISNNIAASPNQKRGSSKRAPAGKDCSFSNVNVSQTQSSSRLCTLNKQQSFISSLIWLQLSLQHHPSSPLPTLHKQAYDSSSLPLGTFSNNIEQRDRQCTACCHPSGTRSKDPLEACYKHSCVLATMPTGIPRCSNEHHGIRNTL